MWPALLLLLCAACLLPGVDELGATALVLETGNKLLGLPFDPFACTLAFVGFLVRELEGEEPEIAGAKEEDTNKGDRGASLGHSR